MNYVGALNEDKELINGKKNILIYGASGYGEKIYRNLRAYSRDNAVKAFVDDKKDIKFDQDTVHSIPIMNIEEATEKYKDYILCISEDIADEKKQLFDKCKDSIHIINFNLGCERWGTEYGGFYIPKKLTEESPFLVYSFGIGEDLSFSEEVIARGGECYAFDPTPKAIEYVKGHKLSSNTRFHFYPIGLSDKDGMEEFYLPVRLDYVSASVINHKNVDSQRKIHVQMKTLRTIMKELKHEKIDILKMDIEGSEFKVVNDMMNDKFDPINFQVFCVETHERFFEGRECIDNLYEELQKNGFYDCYGTVREPTFIKWRKMDQ